MLATFLMQLEDEPAALERVTGLVRRRGFKVRSLNAGEVNAGRCLRITLQVAADDKDASQLRSWLSNLPSVKRVDIVCKRACVVRELAIIKVAATRDERAEIMEIASDFRAQVIDVSRGSLILEATGGAAKVHALIEALEIYGIIDIARTGHVAMIRGVKVADLKGEAGVLQPNESAVAQVE